MVAVLFERVDGRKELIVGPDENGILSETQNGTGHYDRVAYGSRQVISVDSVQEYLDQQHRQLLGVARSQLEAGSRQSHWIGIV